MGSSKPEPATTTQKIEPPSYARPGLEFAAKESLRQFQEFTPEYFPGSTVVPFAPQTELALGLAEQRALEGSPLIPSSQQTALNIIQGRGVNPFLSGASQAVAAPLFERFEETTLPALRSSFASIGRSGSGAEERALQQATRELGRGVSEQAANLAFRSAEAEAARQAALLPMAGTLAAQDFSDIQQLANVGATREDLAARQLQEDIARFQFGQNVEQAKLNALIGQLQGVVPIGGGTTIGTVQQPGTNRFLTGLGGAASGAATGAAIGSVIPGIGTAIGAGVGGGLGLLGGIL